jgi:hydroxymethylpyrimidine/phosphomethylpyrimidine kinase
MAAHLALGASLVDAVRQARVFVREALLSGAQVRTGQGSGPLNHGYAPRSMQRKILS